MRRALQQTKFIYIYLLLILAIVVSSCGKVEDSGAESKPLPGGGSTNSSPTISLASSTLAINEDAVGSTITLTVNDSQTVLELLDLTADSSEPSIVNQSGLSISSGGASRTLSITPVENAFGTTTITVEVSDEEKAKATATLLLTVSSDNDAPTISADPTTPIVDASMDEDQLNTEYKFTIEDVDNSFSELYISADSSNTSVIPNTGFSFSSITGTTTLAIVPEQHKNTDGSPDVTVTVTISDGLLSSDVSFDIRVNPVNDAPVIEAIPDQTTDVLIAIPITISDIDLDTLSLDVTTDEPLIFPSIDISDDSSVITHVVISTAPDQNGRGHFWVTVSDGKLQDTTDFELTLNPCRSQNSGSVLLEATFETGAFDCGRSDNNVEIQPGDNVYWDRSSDTFSGNIIVENGAVFRITDNGAITGNIILNGGTLQVDQTADIRGDISINGNSTIDITADAKLSYSGQEIKTGPYTLTMAGPGEFDNTTNPININDADGSLNITGAKAVRGDIRLSGGTLKIDKNVILYGDLIQAADATIDIDSSATFQYNGSAELDIGNNELVLTGDGMLDNSSAIFINNPSTLIISGAMEIQGTLKFGDGSLRVLNNVTHTGALSINSAPTIYIEDSFSFSNPNFPFNLTGHILNLTGKGDLSADVILSNTTLNVTNSSLISGDIGYSGTSTINIGRDNVLSYSGAAFNLGATTLSFIGEGTFDNTNDIVLNDPDSQLNLNGANGIVRNIHVSGAINAGKGIVVSDDFTINQLSQESNAMEISVADLKTLKLTDSFDASADITLTVTGQGTLNTLSLLALTGDLNLNQTVTLDVDGGLTIPATRTLSVGTATLDLRDSSLVLGADLNASLGTLLTSNTDFDLSSNVTLTSNQTVSVNSLEFYGNTLTLGDETTDLIVADATDDWGVGEGIITGEADLTINNISIWISNGASLTSTSGKITLEYGVRVFTGGTLNIADTELIFKGTLKADSGTFVTDSSTDLSLIGSTSIEVDNSLSVRNLDLANNSLFIYSPTTSFTVSGEIVNGIANLEGIHTIDADFSYNAPLEVAGGTFSSTGGTISLDDVTVDSSGGLILTGSTLNLGGNLYAVNGDITTDATTDLLLQADSVITSRKPLALRHLTVSGQRLTLGSESSHLTVNGNITGLSANTDQIITGLANLTITSPLTVSNQAEISSSGGTVFLADATFDTQASLTISGGELKLGGDLNASDGTLTPSASTNLVLASAATLTSAAPVNFNQLDTASFLLTLGDASSDMTVDSLVREIAGGTEGIDTGDADFTISNAVKMSGGLLASSNGSLIFDASVDATGGAVSFTGGSVSIGSEFNAQNLDLTATNTMIALGGDTVLNPASSATTGSRWQIGTSNTLFLNGAMTFSGDVSVDSLATLETNASVSLAGDISLSGGTLRTNTATDISGDISASGGTIDINANTSVSGGISYTSSNLELFIANAATLTYSNTPIVIDNNSLVISDTGVFEGDLQLAGGSLSINAAGDVSGDITLTADSTVDILSEVAFDYTGAEILLAGRKLAINAGEGASFNTTNPINLNNASSHLSLTKDSAASHTSGVTISNIVVTGSTISGSGLDVTGIYTVSALSQGANSSFVEIADNAALILDAMYDVPAGQSLTLAGDGTFDANQPLVVNGTLDQTGDVYLNIDGDLQISSTGELKLGTGFLDLTANRLYLESDLNTSAGTIIASSSYLDLSADVTLTTAQDVTFDTLALNDNLLIQGTSSSGLTIIDITGDWELPAEGINSQNANLTFINPLDVNGGVLLSSGGTLTFEASADISADGLDLSGTIVSLGGDLSIALPTSGDLTTDATTDLILTENTVLTYNQPLGIGDLNLNSKQLSLGAGSQLFTVNGTLQGGITTAELIDTGDVSFTYNSPLTISGGTLRTSGGIIDLDDLEITGAGAGLYGTGGTVMLVDVTTDATGILSLSGAVLDLGGRLYTSSTGDLTTDANTDLTLSANATIDRTTSTGVMIVRNLDITGQQLTLATEFSDLSIGGTITGLSAGTDMIQTGAADLTLTPALTVSGGAQITSTGGTITLSDATFDSSTLDISSTQLVLNGNLNTAVGTGALVTDGTSDLSLMDHVTLTSNDAILIDDLILGGYLLTLGNGNSDMTVDDINALNAGITNSGEGIDTGLADLALPNKLTMTDGRLLSSGGDLRFFGDIAGSNIEINIQGGFVYLSGNLTLNPNSATLNTTDSTWDVETHTLAMDGSYVFAGDINATGGGILDINSTPTISGDIAYTSGDLTISLGNDTLTYTGASLPITNAGSFILDETGRFAGNLTLSGGVLQVPTGGVIVDLSGDIALSQDSTIDIASNVDLNYLGNDINLSDKSLVINAASNASFDNTGVLILDDPNSMLVLTASGPAIAANVAKVTTSGNITTAGKGLDVNAQYTISTLSQTSLNSIIDIAGSAQLNLTDPFSLANGNTLELSGTGVLASNGLFTIGGTLNQTGTATLDINSNLILESTGVLNINGGILDVRQTLMTLGNHLDTSGGTLRTDSSTDLILSQSLTLNTAQAITIDDLDLGNSLLTLGDATTDLNILGTIATWGTLGEGIDTGNADLSITPVLNILGAGSLLSSGGSLTFENNAVISGDAFDASDTTLFIGGDLTITATDQTTDATTTHLVLNGDSTLTYDQSMDVANLAVNSYTLTLASNSPAFDVSGDVSGDISGSVGSLAGINTNNVSFGCASGFQISSYGKFESSGGVLNLKDVTVDVGGEFTMLNSTLKLDGNLTTTGGSLVTNASSNLELLSNAIITSDDAITLQNLTLSGYTLTQGSASSTISVSTALTGLTAGTDAIISGAADLTITPAITVSNSAQITSTGGALIFGNDVTFDSGATLDISSTRLELGGNLYTSAGNLVTNIATDLTLAAHSTITSNDPIRIDDLVLGSFLLSLGDATTDTTVDTITGIVSSGSAGIDSGTANLAIDDPFTMTAGTLSSSGGELRLGGASSMSGTSTLSTTGDTLVYLDGDLSLNLNPGNFDTTDSTWDIGSRKLTLDGGVSFAGDINASGGTLEINSATTINGNIAYSLNGLILELGNKILTYGGTAIPINNNNALQFSESGSFYGDLELTGGSLSINSSVDVSGDIILTADSTVDILGGTVLDYDGSDITFDGFTMVIRAGNDASFDNAGALLLNNTNSLVHLIGKDAITDIVSINQISVTADTTTDTGIKVEGAYNVTTLSQGATNESMVNVVSGAVLTVTDPYTVPNGEVFYLSGSGELVTNGLLSVNGTLAQSGSAIIDADGGLTIGNNGLLTLGTGTLDLRSSTLSLNNDLDTSTGTFQTDSNTDLTLGDSVTLTTAGSGGTKEIGNLDFGGFLLTLGSASPGLKVNTISSWSGANEGIDSQGSDLQFSANVQMSNGSLLSSGGTFTFDGTSDAALTGGGFDVSGTTISLGRDLSIAITDLTTDASSAWNLNGNKLTWDGTGDIFRGTLTLNSGSELNILTNEAVLDATMDLAGGTLNVDVTTDLSTGLLSLSADSTIDIADNAALSHSGAVTNLNGKHLLLSGGGNLNNTNAIVLNSATSGLQVTGTSTINSVAVTADLTTGEIDIDENVTINTLSTQFDTDISVASGKTLDVSNDLSVPTGKSINLTGPGTFDIAGNLTITGAFVSDDATLDSNSNLTINGSLTMSNGGRLDVSNDMSIGAGATLVGGSSDIDLTNTSSLTLNGTLSAGTGTLTIGSAINSLSLGTLDVSKTTVSQLGDLAISTGTFTTDASTDWTVPAGQDLSWNGAGSSLKGTFNIQGGSGSRFNLHTSSPTVTAVFNLNQGILDLSTDSTWEPDSVINLQGDATIDVLSTKTLTYRGTEIEIGANRLSVGSGGTLNNTNLVDLNNANSFLALSGGGTIETVGVTSDVTTDKGIDLSGNFYFTDLLLAQDLYFDGNNNILEITNDLTVNNSDETVDITLTINTPELRVHDLVLWDSLDINTVSGGLYLENDSRLIVKNDVTFGPGDDLTFKGGLYIYNDSTLTISDPSGDFTLTIEGGITIEGSGKIKIDGGETLKIQNPDPSDEIFSKIEVVNGTLIPDRISTFSASVTASNAIHLEWNDDYSGSVVICRSTTGFFAVPCDATNDSIYDGNDSSTDDTGRTNGVTYYYTAFSHDGSHSYTGALNASATAYDPSGNYFSYEISNFTATPDDSAISLSWTDATGDYAGVKILRKTGGYPDSTSDSAATEIYDGTADTYMDKGLKNGTLYYYRAFAYDSSTVYSPGINTLAAPAIIPSSMVSYYPLNDTVLDGGGQENHGSLINADASIDAVADMQNRSDQAYTFDGVNDFFEISNPVSDDFSISFWMKTSQSSGAINTDWYNNIGIIDGYNDASLQNDFGISLGNAGEILFGVAKQDGATSVTIAGPAVNTNSWVHITVTRSQSLKTIKLYVDGFQQATSGGTDNQPLNSPELLQIGRQEGGSYYDGELDEIRFYNRVLTPVEIQKLHFSERARVEANLGVRTSHGCVLLDGEKVNCWGTSDSIGRLGDDSTSSTTQTVPVEVSGISSAMQISTGANHTCAALRDGTISCWGDGANGKLGTNSTSAQVTPDTVLDLTSAIQVSAGSEHTCAVIDSDYNSTIQCWGLADNGRLGNGQTSGFYSKPDDVITQVSTVDNAVQVEAGYDFTCALLKDKKVMCWGNGEYGRLGDGTQSSSPTPVYADLTGAVQLSVGDYHACALLDTGKIKCWGSQLDENLLDAGVRMGDGTSVDDNKTPVEVSGISNAVQVSAGNSHTCAVLNDNTVKCWGDVGSTIEVSPVNAIGVSNAIHVSSGEDDTCVIDASSDVKCWGVGNEIQSSAPVDVTLGTDTAKQ